MEPMGTDSKYTVENKDRSGTITENINPELFRQKTLFELISRVPDDKKASTYKEIVQLYHIGNLLNQKNPLNFYHVLASLSFDEIFDFLLAATNTAIMQGTDDAWYEFLQREIFSPSDVEPYIKRLQTYPERIQTLDETLRGEVHISKLYTRVNSYKLALVKSLLQLDLFTKKYYLRIRNAVLRFLFKEGLLRPNITVPELTPFNLFGKNSESEKILSHTVKNVFTDYFKFTVMLLGSNAPRSWLYKKASHLFKLVETITPTFLDAFIKEKEKDNLICFNGNYFLITRALDITNIKANKTKSSLMMIGKVKNLLTQEEISRLLQIEDNLYENLIFPKGYSFNETKDIFPFDHNYYLVIETIDKQEHVHTIFAEFMPSNNSKKIAEIKLVDVDSELETKLKNEHAERIKTRKANQYSFTAIQSDKIILITQIFRSFMYYISQVINLTFLIKLFVKRRVLPFIEAYYKLMLKIDVPPAVLEQISSTMTSLMDTTLIQTIRFLYECFSENINSPDPIISEKEHLNIINAKGTQGAADIRKEILTTLAGNVEYLQKLTIAMLKFIPLQFLEKNEELIFEINPIKDKLALKRADTAHRHEKINQIDINELIKELSPESYERIAKNFYRWLKNYRFELPLIPKLIDSFNSLTPQYQNFELVDFLLINEKYYIIADVIKSSLDNKNPSTLIMKLVLPVKQDDPPNWIEITDQKLSNEIHTASFNSLKNKDYIQVVLYASFRQNYVIEPVINDLSILGIKQDFIHSLLSERLKYLPVQPKKSDNNNIIRMNLIEYAESKNRSHILRMFYEKDLISKDFLFKNLNSSKLYDEILIKEIKIPLYKEIEMYSWWKEDKKEYTKKHIKKILNTKDKRDVIPEGMSADTLLTENEFDDQTPDDKKRKCLMM